MEASKDFSLASKQILTSNEPQEAISINKAEEGQKENISEASKGMYRDNTNGIYFSSSLVQQSESLVMGVGRGTHLVSGGTKDLGTTHEKASDNLGNVVSTSTGQHLCQDSEGKPSFGNSLLWKEDTTLEEG